MGHIRDLPPKQLGVDVERRFHPTYHLRKGGRKVLQRLRQGIDGANAVILATDPDREGEAIAWQLTRALRKELKDLPITRVTFHEITPGAVREALAAPGELDMDLVGAQQARRVLDRLVGYQVSPVLWKAVKGPRGLSAGRVQTVALRLVVERDRDIEQFMPQEYWTLDAEYSKHDDPQRFRARLVRIGRRKPELRTQNETQSIVADLEGAEHRVAKVERRQQVRQPYPPYTTSTLQQDGANRLGWGAAKTLKIAQQLYEGVALPGEGAIGLITYMRTDSTHVAAAAQREAREVIGRVWGEDYLPERPPTYRTRSKVAQEAHEAIRPTSPQRTPRDLVSHLTPDQARLYELIWRRFIASQMKPARHNVTAVDIKCTRSGNDLPYIFRATGRELLFAGFLKAYEVQDEKPSDEDGAAGQVLPPLATGDPLRLHGLFPEQHFTKPPPHFTEASLIKEMERLGLGRPSTYAAIIQVILRRSYVERRKKSLHATELGFGVCDFLVAQFPDLFAVEFTARMEEQLDAIARGERDWVDVLTAFYGPFAEAVAGALTATAGRVAAAASPASKPPADPAGQHCPECGGEAVLREGKYGRFRGCRNYPRCKWRAPIVVGQCPRCGGDLVERSGKRGPFWGCMRYPGCRFTREPETPDAGQAAREVTSRSGGAPPD